MAWKSPVITGTESVAANKQYLDDNSIYIKAKQQLDHYWDETAGLDGHHKYVNMPKLESGGTPIDPTLPAGLNLNYYCKQKTTTESPTHVPVMPFTKDASGAVLELLGIRAMCVFSMSGTTITQNYSHNMNPQVHATPGIVLDATGFFTANFASALPSVNYAFYGGAMANGTIVSPDLNVNIRPDTDLTTNKTAALCKFRSVQISTPFAATNPLQCWFVVFGG